MHLHEKLSDNVTNDLLTAYGTMLCLDQNKYYIHDAMYNRMENIHFARSLLGYLHTENLCIGSLVIAYQILRTQHGIMENNTKDLDVV